MVHRLRHILLGQQTMPMLPTAQENGRLAQRESASLTRRKSQVQILYRPRNKAPRLFPSNPSHDVVWLVKQGKENS